MTKRKSLSKKIRFEVFKRDCFTCQYCGAKAPDVVLHVDHIKPVASGGTNSVLNLVTSCQPCNSGKGARELSNDAAVLVARKQTEELSSKKEQLHMMADWQHEMSSIKNTQIDIIEGAFCDGTPWSFSESGRQMISKVMKRFSTQEILEAVEIAIDQYFNWTNDGLTLESWNDALDKIGGICWNRKHRDGL